MATKENTPVAGPAQKIVHFDVHGSGGHGGMFSVNPIDGLTDTMCTARRLLLACEDIVSDGAEDGLKESSALVVGLALSAANALLQSFHNTFDSARQDLRADE